MSALLWINEGPIRKKLLKELNALSADLSELEASLDTYFSRDLPQFQSWVNYQFADDLVQISGLEKKVHALGTHVEESIQLSMKMNLQPTDLFADWSEEKILEKIFAEDEGEEPEVALPETSASKSICSGEVKDVFRKIARILHPDLRGQTKLAELEKNLWIKAQRAYAQNDVFELMRIEQTLKSGKLQEEPVSCSELLRQLQDFQKKLSEIKEEAAILKNERAWHFSERKNHNELEREIATEYNHTLRDLKSREQHFQKTLRSWIKAPEKTKAPPKKRNSKSQVSLF